MFEIIGGMTGSVLGKVVVFSPGCIGGGVSWPDLQGKTHRLSDYRGKWLLENHRENWQAGGTPGQLSG